MTDQQQNQISTVVNDIESYMLTGADVKKNFQTNEIQKIFLENQDIPKRDVISYLHLIQLTGANPALKQIYLTSHFDKKKGHKVGTPVFSYHFLMAKAKETGKYNGVIVETGAEDLFCPFKNEEKKELVANATVIVDDVKYSFKAVWSEFYQAYNPIWKSKPRIMLEKCAIAGVLKRAFPEALNGMVTDVEHDRKEIVTVENLSEMSSDILAPAEEKETIAIEVKSAKYQEQAIEKPEQIQEVAGELFQESAFMEKGKQENPRETNKKLKFSLDKGDKKNDATN